MTVPFARKLCSALFPAALGLLSSAAGAQSAPDSDQVAAATEPRAEEDLPAYHHSLFSWEHAATSQTLGVGDTPQSSNPTYTMGLVARTRYYFLDDTPGGRHFSLRVDGGLYREFTNSDVTAKRGEWTFSDTDVASVYMRRFQGPADRDGTSWEVRPLTLTLPTSKMSLSSGRYFAPGVALGIINMTPLLRGKIEPEIVSLVRLAIGYKRWFARATVPTNTSLERVRLTPEGRALPGDSLSGSSLVRDQVELTARLRFEIGQDVMWTTDAAFVPSWKYPVQYDVPLCGVVLTGCTNVQVSPQDSRFVAQTSINTEVSVRFVRGFSVQLGYGNAATQIGQDGRRRGFFYSPSAVFYTSLTFAPHELATTTKQIAENHPASPRL